MSNSRNLADLLDANGDVSLGDNVKAKFGAGNDLQIYSVGNTSYIHETGSGDFYIKGSSIYVTDSSNNQFIHCNDTGTGGTVSLKHGGSTKLNTTATGIDVTGSVTCDGLLSEASTKISHSGGLTLTQNATAEGLGYVAQISAPYANESFRIAVNGNKVITTEGYNSATQLILHTNGSERMRITSAGNVGIGTSSPAAKLDVVGNINAAGTLKLGSIAAGGLTTTGWSIGSSGTGTIRNNVTNNEAVVFDNTGGTGFYKIDFRRANSSRGGIQVFDTGTSYTTTSDYRLKENVVPMTGSIDRLKELKPSRFNFIADADKTVDGFLAHEAGEVVPECATGTKDAMKDEEYEVTPAVMDGDTVVTEAVMGTRSVPDYQGIDQSKLVPLLVASLQEAIARIEQLEQGA